MKRLLVILIVVLLCLVGCGENYDENHSKWFNELKNDKTVAVLTAGTPGDFELSKEVREKMGKQYIDVGIAEEHAVAMSSGLAKNGAKPVFCVCSSFIQRTYDQLSQDLCLNNNPYSIELCIQILDLKYHLGGKDRPIAIDISLLCVCL